MLTCGLPSHPKIICDILYNGRNAWERKTGKGRVVHHSSNELNSYTPKKNIVSREQESDNNLVELWRGTKTTRRLHKREPHEKCQDIRLPHVKPHRAPYGESCVRLAVIKQLYGNQQSV